MGVEVTYLVLVGYITHAYKRVTGRGGVRQDSLCAVKTRDVDECWCVRGKIIQIIVLYSKSVCYLLFYY